MDRVGADYYPQVFVYQISASVFASAMVMVMVLAEGLISIVLNACTG